MEALLVALGVVIIFDRIRIHRLYRRIDRLEKILIGHIEHAGLLNTLLGK